MKKTVSLILFVFSILIMFVGCGRNNTYIIATDLNMSPFSSVDSTGAAVGFEIDIIKEIAAEQGINVEFYSVGYPEALEEIEDGHADVAMAAIIPTDELSQKFDFTDIYYNNEYAVAVKKGKNAKFIEMFNEGLSKIKENGKYNEIYSNYFGNISESAK